MTETWEYDPEEAEKQAKEVAAALIKTVPQFGPDSRQEGFFAFVDEMRKREDFDEHTFIPMDGFHASNVNMGWFRDRFDTLVEEFYESHGPYYIMSIMDEIVSKAIQRLKSRLMHYNSEIHAIEVVLIAVDDQGSYEYRIAVRTPPDEEPKEEADGA